MMNKIMWIGAVAVILFFVTARKDADEKSAFYSNAFWGQRVGVLIGGMEHDKVKLCRSGSVAVLWMSDADFWKYRGYNFDPNGGAK